MRRQRSSSVLVSSSDFPSELARPYYLNETLCDPSKMSSSFHFDRPSNSLLGTKSARKKMAGALREFFSWTRASPKDPLLTSKLDDPRNAALKAMLRRRPKMGQSAVENYVIYRIPSIDRRAPIYVNCRHPYPSQSKYCSTNPGCSVWDHDLMSVDKPLDRNPQVVLGAKSALRLRRIDHFLSAPRSSNECWTKRFTNGESLHSENTTTYDAMKCLQMPS